MMKLCFSASDAGELSKAGGNLNPVGCSHLTMVGNIHQTGFGRDLRKTLFKLAEVSINDTKNKKEESLKKNKKSNGKMVSITFNEAKSSLMHMCF